MLTYCDMFCDVPKHFSFYFAPFDNRLSVYYMLSDIFSGEFQLILCLFKWLLELCELNVFVNQCSHLIALYYATDLFVNYLALSVADFQTHNPLTYFCLGLSHVCRYVKKKIYVRLITTCMAWVICTYQR